MQGFEIVGVSADSKRESMERFMENHNIPWINGFSGKGRNDEVVSLYKIDSFPIYIVIDKNGLVRLSIHKGGEKLRKIMSELIAE